MTYTLFLLGRETVKQTSARVANTVMKVDLDNLVRGVLFLLFELKEIQDLVVSNIQNNKGKEELYPYFNLILLKCYIDRFGSIKDIYGIGYGEIDKKKIDCLLIIRNNSNIHKYALEIKGPSHDRGNICREIENDKKKLMLLRDKNLIIDGLSIGLLLHKPGNQKDPPDCDLILDLQCGRVGVKFMIHSISNSLKAGNTTTS